MSDRKQEITREQLAGYLNEDLARETKLSSATSSTAILKGAEYMAIAKELELRREEPSTPHDRRADRLPGGSPSKSPSP
jgi:hypothetical protein